MFTKKSSLCQQLLTNNPSPSIQPATELLSKHPELTRMQKQLAQKYAYNELVTDEMLQIIGKALWQALEDDGSFDSIHAKTGRQILPLIIESNDPAILQLPWETLHHPEHGFLALEQGFTLSRKIPEAPEDNLTLETGPLRVLLFTAMTEDQNRLNVEKEQAQVQEALLPYIAEGSVILEMPDDGRFKTFQNILKSYQPHLVFLSGHGKFYPETILGKAAYANFLFETEGDDSHVVTETELAQAFIGTQAQCVVLSACESGMSASDQLNVGLLHSLALQGIPHVIGMRESILDPAGIQFNRHFCDAIANQERVDYAIQQARSSITQPLTGELRDTDSTGIHELSLGQWCLPLLLSQNPDLALINWNFQRTIPEKTRDKQSLDSISLPAVFIGRRRELKILDPALADHSRNKLLITGLGGQGKTAMAGRLAQKLLEQGCKTLSWSARNGGDWSGFQFDLETSLNDEAAKTYNRMLEKCTDESQKIKLLLNQLIQQSDQHLVLLFDNLESLQDPTSLEITDHLTQTWIKVAAELAGTELTVLITSRWRFPDWPEADHWPLEHFTYNDYLQLARSQNLSAALLGN